MKENEGEMAQHSEYPIRPGEKDCQFYLKTGRCGFGEKCCYNHPKGIPEKINLPKCKYFLSGDCMFGSRCVYDHSKEGDGAEPMRQKRQRTKSSPSPYPEKRAKTIPDPRNGDPRERFEENVQGQRQEKKRRETQNNLLEERLMENHNDQQNMEEERKRDIERQRREARLRIDQIKPTVHFNDVYQIRKTLAELGIIHTEGDGF